MCAAESIVKWVAYWDGRSKDNSCHGRAHNKNVLIQDFKDVSGIVSLISAFDTDVCLDWRSKRLAATESIPPEHLIILNHAPGCWRMMAWCNLLTPKPKCLFFHFKLHPEFMSNFPGSSASAPFLSKSHTTSRCSSSWHKIPGTRSEGHANKQNINCALQINMTGKSRQKKCSWKLLFFIEASMSCDLILCRSDCTCSC